MKIVKSIDELIAYLGIKPGDKVEITGPQFERETPIEIDFIPKTKEELMTLIKSAPKEVLIKMGCRIWCTGETELLEYESPYLEKEEIHWLYPHEWYAHLPEGLQIINILEEWETFEPGETDDDMRFGCLAYGFIRNEKTLTTKPQ